MKSPKILTHRGFLKKSPRIQISGNSIEKSERESGNEMYFLLIVNGFRLVTLHLIPFLLELKKIRDEFAGENKLTDKKKSFYKIPFF